MVIKVAIVVQVAQVDFVAQVALAQADQVDFVAQVGPVQAVQVDSVVQAALAQAAVVQVVASGPADVQVVAPVADAQRKSFWSAKSN